LCCGVVFFVGIFFGGFFFFVGGLWFGLGGGCFVGVLWVLLEVAGNGLIRSPLAITLLGLLPKVCPGQFPDRARRFFAICCCRYWPVVVHLDCVNLDGAFAPFGIRRTSFGLCRAADYRGFPGSPASLRPCFYRASFVRPLFQCLQSIGTKFQESGPRPSSFPGRFCRLMNSIFPRALCAR